MKQLITKKSIVWLFFLAALFFYLRLFRNALIDDSFIVLNYVKTLVASGTWGFFPGYVTNSVTSPLSVILLALIAFITGPTVIAPLVLTFVCYVVAAVFLTKISAQLFETDLFGWLAVVGLVFNPLLTSTIGLESILFAMLFILSLFCFLQKKWNWLAVSLGLLTITRADGALFFIVFLLFINDRKLQLRLFLLYLLTIAPWHFFSWVYLGSFLPDTLFIKTDYKSWGIWDFFNGLGLYYINLPVETILSFVFLPLAGWALFDKRRRTPLIIIVALGGLFHYMGYTVLGVPPFHWYYAPEAVTFVLVGSFGLGEYFYKAVPPQRKKLFQPIVLAMLFVPVFGMSYLLAQDQFRIKEMPIHSSWATHEKYKEIGLWLKGNAGGQPVELVKSEVGTLAYYCDCYLLNEFSDRRWTAEYIRTHENNLFYRINFMFFDARDFPTYGYSIRGTFKLPQSDIEIIKTWDVSTKWIPQAVIYVYK